MLDSRQTLAYIRILQGGWPRCQPTSAQCRRHARQERSYPGRPWREATSAFACLPRDWVVFTLPRTMGGDDGGTTSTQQRRCVMAGLGHCAIRPASPARGGCTAARPGCAGRDMTPRGITWRDRVVSKGSHQYWSVRPAQSSCGAAFQVPSWAAPRPSGGKTCGGSTDWYGGAVP
jgi:hypothetical protein